MKMHTCWYLSSTSSHQITSGSYRDCFGYIIGPRSFGPRQVIKDGAVWAMDNDCFNRPFDEAPWLAVLREHQPFQKGCLFVATPDRYGDSRTTLQLLTQYAPTIKELGYRVALVTQDGLSPIAVPWNTIDALFIGGSNQHKLGTEAGQLIAEGLKQGKWIHIGRVNSARRLFQFWQADSWDGNTLAFYPTTATHIGRAVRVIRAMKNTSQLFGNSTGSAPQESGRGMDIRLVKES